MISNKRSVQNFRRTPSREVDTVANNHVSEENLFQLARQVRDAVEGLYHRYTGAVNSELLSQRLVFFALLAAAPAWITHEVLFWLRPESVTVRVAAGAAAFGLLMLLAFAWNSLAGRRLIVSKRQFEARAYRVLDDNHARHGLNLQHFARYPRSYQSCAALEDLPALLQLLEDAPPAELLPWLPGVVGFSIAMGFSAAACLTASALCRDVNPLHLQADDLALPVLALVGAAFTVAGFVLGWTSAANSKRSSRSDGENTQPVPESSAAVPSVPSHVPAWSVPAVLLGGGLCLLLVVLLVLA
jgi:hypothetical protein